MRRARGGAGVWVDVALALSLSMGASLAACSLNPQPEPPGDEIHAAGSGGNAGSGSSAGSKASPGGAGGGPLSGGQGGSADTAAGAGGQSAGAVGQGGSNAPPGPGGAGGGQAGQGGAGGSSGNFGGGAGGSGETGTGGSSTGVAGEGGSGATNSAGGSGNGGSGNGGAGNGTGGSGTGGTSAGGSSAQGGSGGAGGEPATSVGQACAALAQATCEKWQACSPFELETTYGGLESCLPRFEAACEKQLASPGSNTSNGQHLSCASAIGKASCDAFLTGAVGGACVPAPGEREAGAPCGDDAQCKSGFCDRKGLCGSCASPPQPGDSCPASGDCGPGLACSKSGTCVAYAGLGAPCASAPCLPSLACKAGACAKPMAEGEACVEGECDDLAGLTCSGGVCATIALVPAGQSCGPALSSPVACSAASHCLASGEGATCVADLPDGSPCSATSASCRVLSACIDGTCSLPDPGACQ